ncbi:uncharacterized protein LOC103988976 [Musa acuminata AAA Group]|uniref:uncharacterized protein LOC103988976 n=1 Tax=Musa acuminata AAA Group TaxID=214697 RepID=UPI0031E46710
MDRPFFFPEGQWNTAGRRRREQPRHPGASTFSPGERDIDMDSPFLFSEDPWITAGLRRDQPRHPGASTFSPGERDIDMDSPFFFSEDPWITAGRRRGQPRQPVASTFSPRETHIDMDSPFLFSEDPWITAGRRREQPRHPGASTFSPIEREIDMDRPFFFSEDPGNTAGHHREQPRRPAASPAVNDPVFSVPVCFGSDVAAAAKKRATALPSKATRSAAAVAIQRVLRGHLVRKNVRVVSRLAAELGEIEQMVRSGLERLLAEPKERLRVSEMLMALLFRLDSVRGVREYRKRVIRRVISLQEFLDSVFGQTQTLESPIPAETHGEIRDRDAILEEVGEMPQDDNAEEETASGSKDVSVQESDPDSNQDPILAVVKQVSDTSDESFETLDLTDDLKKEEEKAVIEDFVVLSMEEAIDPSQMRFDSAANPEKAAVADLIEQENREAAAGISTTIAEAETGAARPHMSETVDVLKKVMAETERLQGLVAALCEQNTQQCMLMTDVVERVEHLERAVQTMGEKKKEKKIGAAKC